MKSALKRTLSGTSLYPVAQSVNDRLVEPLHDRIVARSLSPTGFHHVDPSVDGIPPFEIWLPGHGRFQRARMRGELEQPVMETVACYLDDKTVFWEIGAGWGYFSMAVAGTAEQVVAFELRRELVDRIRESAERNGYTNVTAVEGTVGGDVDLSAYPEPDLVVMDIEGWEYEALVQNPSLLAAKPVLILEVHEPAMVDSSVVPVATPETLRAFLKSNGYALELLDKRAEDNYHLLVRPP